jgi:hypothetical protein
LQAVAKVPTDRPKIKRNLSKKPKALEEVTYYFGASGATPDGCACAHPPKNKRVPSFKKRHAHGRAAEPPNKYQRYFLGRLGGYCLGQ